MKVCSNYSLIHKFLINYILLQTVLLIGVCGACLRKELYIYSKNGKCQEKNQYFCRSFAITNPNWVETVKKYMEVSLKLFENRKKKIHEVRKRLMYKLTNFLIFEP
jgi:hypothetical protein